MSATAGVDRRIPELPGQPTRLRVEHGSRQLGIGTGRPRLSWWLPPGTRHQEAYRLEVLIDDATPTTIEIHSDRSVLETWPLPPLRSRNRIRWRVQVLADGQWSAWSSFDHFEVGLLEPDDWTAVFIGPPLDGELEARGRRGASYLRRRFTVSTPPLRARVRATALGIYELHLDGRRLGDMELTPGFTAYRSLLQVQTYEISDLLQPGVHELVATLTDGWYRGSVGFNRVERCFGDRLGLLAQIELETSPGELVIHPTDPRWEVNRNGPIIAADLIEGARLDLRIPFPPVHGWEPAEPVDPPPGAQITSPVAPPTRRTTTIEPASVTRLDDHRQVVSLPVNINGWLQLDAPALGPEDTRLRLTHGESLGPDRDIDMAALEVVDFTNQASLGHGQVDEVISAGPEGPSFEPRHTTHGFQHVRIEGAPDISPEHVRGVLVHTDLVRTGTFRCSDDRLNRLHDAAVLSFVDNACEIPTDCPQRERAGWTGDWQLFSPTAAFLYDVAGFTDRWLRDLAADQWPDGRVPNTIPDPAGPAGRDDVITNHMTGSAGWGDAATFVPYEMYKAYGDVGLLDRQYPSMVAWVQSALAAAAAGRHHTRATTRPTAAPHEQYLWDTGFHWGEWSEPDADDMDALAGKVDQGHVATAYLARSLEILARTATIIGQTEDSTRWSTLGQLTRDAWQREYLRDDGHVTPRTQATLCRALAFDLVPPHARGAVLADLVALIDDADFHVGTGFLTTPHLLPTLAEEGRVDVAYRLLLQDSVPSWLAMIDAGATTVWENWEPATAERPGSLNHYSKGAVVSFLHRCTAGIRLLDEHPAYRHFEVRPLLGGDLTWAEAQLDSPHGRIQSRWWRHGDGLHLEVEVPPATTALVALPGGEGTFVGPGVHQFHSGTQNLASS